jgi:hypothetical protein
MTKRPLALAVFALAAMAATHTGPEIGAKIPDFQAVDQDGKSHTLVSLLGPKGAVLVVYRSADW